MHNDQTNPNPYPYQPNPYQQQPFQASPPPLPPTNKPAPPKWAMGCTYVILGLLALGLCGGIYSVTIGRATQANSAPTTSPTINPNNGQVVIVATATSQPAQQQADPTATPTKAQPTPALKPVPTHAAAPTPTPKPKPSCNAVNNNPWCYNFSPGKLITAPPSDFCTYFNCIASFVSADDPDGGYVVECSDGTYSQSGGESGSCSHHGGNLRPLYSH